MNHDDVSAEHPEVEPDNVEVTGDPLLNLLAHLAEVGAEAGLTVFTQGQTIAGVLVSRKRYFELSTDAMRGKGFLESVFEAPLKIIEQDEADREELGPAPDYIYLHLRDAQVMAPGQFGMPQEGMLVRLRRSEIVGWSVGVLQARQD